MFRREKSSDEKVGPPQSNCQLALPDHVEDELELVEDHIFDALSGLPTHGARKNPERLFLLCFAGWPWDS